MASLARWNNGSGLRAEACESFGHELKKSAIKPSEPHRTPVLKLDCQSSIRSSHRACGRSVAGTHQKQNLAGARAGYESRLQEQCIRPARTREFRRRDSDDIFHGYLRRL